MIHRRRSPMLTSPLTAPESCAHRHHVGTCPSCQRAAAAHQADLLAAAVAIAARHVAAAPHGGR